MQIVVGKKSVQKIGDIVYNIRCEAGYSQRQLAELLEDYQSNIAKIESNQKKPGLEKLVQILDQLGYELIIQQKE